MSTGREQHIYSQQLTSSALLGGAAGKGQGRKPTRNLSAHRIQSPAPGSYLGASNPFGHHTGNSISGYVNGPISRVDGASNTTGGSLAQMRGIMSRQRKE